MRLGDRLEHLRDERPGVVGLHRHLVRGAPFLRFERRPVGGGWHQLHELGEQSAGPVGQLGRAAEQREDLAPRHPRLQRPDRLIASDLFAPEVALQQRVVRFRDALDQLPRVLIEAGLVLRRHVQLLVLPRLGALLVEVALLGKEVDDAVEFRALAHGDLHRDHLRGQPLLDLVVDLLEVGMLLVHQGDEEHPRHAALLGVVPDLLGAHLDAAGRGHHDDRPVRRPHARERFAGEVQIAGSVDQVELGVHPLGHGDGQVDGVFALDFVRGVIGEGPCRLLVPATNASASTRDVLPLAPWPTTATLRMSPVLYVRTITSGRGGQAICGRRKQEARTCDRLD